MKNKLFCYLIIIAIILAYFISNQTIFAYDVESTYEILGEYFTPSNLRSAGFTQIGNFAWQWDSSDYQSNYLWIDKSNMVYAEGIVFHESVAEVTHDDVAYYIENKADKGNIYKILKCNNDNKKTSECQEIIKYLGSLYSLPITLYETKYSNVICALSQSTAFSNGKESEYIYMCFLLDYEMPTN